jgi:phosphomannomutase/phosphoglucomutase
LNDASVSLFEHLTKFFKAKFAMNEQIFREYDIRGIVGTDLTEETVSVIAKAIGTYFRLRGVKRVALGRDARESSPLFRNLFIESLNSVGCDVLDVGMIPTPLLYFAVFTKSVDAGVMITGSHNPADYNGFKLLLGKDSLHGEQIQEIKRIVLSNNFQSGTGGSEELDIVPEYLDYVAQNIKLGNRKLKVVVDSGNGIGGIIGVPLYRKLGLEIIELFTEPDSRFPNHHPDPTVLKNLQHAIVAVQENDADLAICFDGDADRIGVIDEKGGVLWGDELMVILSRAILKTEPDATFIADVKCSQRLFEDIENHGGNAVMWKAGHSLIKAKMKETHAALAGEMSGHVFYSNRWFGFDDAIYTGARLLEIITNDEKPVSEYLADLPHMISTPEIRADILEERKFDIVQRLTEEFKKTNKVIDIDGARILFDKGWGLVRASNTQPILVLRFEAADAESLKQIQQTVENKLHELSR